MNTLSRTITARFFRTETGFAQLEERWSALLAEDRHRAEILRKARKQDSGIDPTQVEPLVLHAGHHLFYAILRGKDWRRGFTPCTNRAKLENGTPSWRGATAAIYLLHSPHFERSLPAPFADLLTAEALPLIRTLVPKGEGYGWQADPDRVEAYVNSASVTGAEETASV